MALIVLSGFPCSGKTSRAHQIKEMLESKMQEEPLDGQRKNVVIINDELLAVTRFAYDESKTEKVARANLLSQTIRKLSKDNMVICDGMNYIKGFRYQLYCAAREAGVRICTVHIANPVANCLANNAKLPENSRYKEETIQNLFSRYEEPDASVRWDSPLIVLPWCDALVYENEDKSSTQEPNKSGWAHKLPGLRVLDNRGEQKDPLISTTELTSDQKSSSPTLCTNDSVGSMPVNPAEGTSRQSEKTSQRWSRIAEDIWAVTTKGVLKPVHAAVKMATPTSTNFLHVLETTTVLVLTSLLTAVSNSASQYGVTTFPCVLPNSGKSCVFSIKIPIGKTVNVGVLQRLKRQYTTMHKQANAAGRGTSAEDEEEIAGSFVKYVEGAL